MAISDKYTRPDVEDINQAKMNEIRQGTIEEMARIL